MSNLTLFRPLFFLGHVKLASPKSKKTHEKKTKAQSQAITRRKTPIHETKQWLLQKGFNSHKVWSNNRSINLINTSHIFSKGSISNPRLAKAPNPTQLEFKEVRFLRKGRKIWVCSNLPLLSGDEFAGKCLRTKRVQVSLPRDACWIVDARQYQRKLKEQKFKRTLKNQHLGVIWNYH